MHWDFDMYIRNRVDTSPTVVPWASMCKQLFGFIAFMAAMFALGEICLFYRPVVSSANVGFLYVSLSIFLFCNLFSNCIEKRVFVVVHVTIEVNVAVFTCPLTIPVLSSRSKQQIEVIPKRFRSVSSQIMFLSIPQLRYTN